MEFRRSIRLTSGSLRSHSGQSTPILRRFSGSWRPRQSLTPPNRTLVEPVGLPPKPARCIGRASEVETLVGALLAHDRIPVLGPAGIGKSTICLQALHAPRVAERFSARRYFVRCDAATTAEALLAQIGVDLRLDAGPGLSEKVRCHLAEAPAALVLDNLETPWDQEQLETEEVLKQLSAIESLALAITIRGSSRPLGVAWRDALQTAPLSGDDPKRLFLAIAGAKHENDPHLSRLLFALDGMPLAIELMAHAAEAEPDLDSVWRRWQAERSKMLKRGKGDQRLLSLAVSLELSLASPRMTDPARRLLAMLSLVPNGIPRGDVNILVPGCGDAAGATLRQAALAFDAGGRLRCLAPIREYISAAHPPSVDDYLSLLNQLSQLHLDRKKLAALRASLGKLLHERPSDEANLTLAKIKDGIKSAERIVTIRLEDAEKLALHGLFVSQSLNNAEVEAFFLVFSAKVSRMLADQSDAQSRYNNAQEWLHKALSLYQDIGDARGEANCVKELKAIAKARTEDVRRGRAEKEVSGSTRWSRRRTRPGTPHVKDIRRSS